MVYATPTPIDKLEFAEIKVVVQVCIQLRYRVSEQVQVLYLEGTKTSEAAVHRERRGVGV